MFRGVSLLFFPTHTFVSNLVLSMGIHFYELWEIIAVPLAVGALQSHEGRWFHPGPL